MCGRFTFRSHNPRTFADLFGVDPPDGLRQRFNIAPSQDIVIVRALDGVRRADLAHWGLVPSWAKDSKIGYKMINARAETVFEKPAYRSAIRKRRCLIPADGFYEWKKDGKAKIPHWIHIRDEALLAFAGIWERWISADGEVLDSCCIITTTPNEVAAQVHDRMPVILAKDDHDVWLDPEATDPERLRPLMVPYPTEEMHLYPVGSKVNSPRCDDAECVKRVD